MQLKTQEQRKLTMKINATFIFGLGLQIALITTLMSCVRGETVSKPASDSTLVQIQSSCGTSRLFLFSHVVPKLKDVQEKDWSCWYLAKSQRVFGQPTEEESREMFSQAEPVVARYINSNVLTLRLAEIDKQRTAIMWLGTGLALLGCGALAAGSGGLALAACTLLGSSPAAYDVLGGDPSLGARDAWRKMTELSDAEISRMECNAINNIVQQARLIDRKILPFGRGSSKKSCPTAASLAKNSEKISGAQAGVQEIRTLKLSQPSDK